MRRKLAAGNWKMNGTRADLAQVDALLKAHPAPSVDMVLCPPATLLAPMVERAATDPLEVGGQYCHANQTGAHTGDISAKMMADAGARYVITGHSERRTDHGETNADVLDQTLAAWDASLTAIVCIGETLEQRETGQTLTVLASQMAGSVPEAATGANLVIAYEPVWAIGTGKVASLEQIAEVHDFMRAELTDRFGTQTAGAIRLLYGGSVKAANAAEIFATSNVDGALVGGASLTAADFAPIVAALEASA